MEKMQRGVAAFYKAFNLFLSEAPTIPPAPEAKRALGLIDEEYRELVDAIERENLVDIADAHADLLYVVLASALTFGMDMEPIFAEVQRSNMSKIGGRKREDGKWLKPTTYSRPNLGPILEKQIKEGIKLNDHLPTNEH